MSRGFRPLSLIAALVGGLAFAAPAAAQLPPDAQLPQAEEPATATLPEAGPHWVYILENVFPHLIVGKVWIVDGDKLDVVGMVNTGYTPNMAVAKDLSELYVAETYWSRGTRGERSDMVTVYDARSLEPTHEIALPNGRFLVVIKKYDAVLSGDGRYLLSFNMAPATTVSVVDVKDRRHVGEIETPGCALIFPTGPRRFSMMCAEGALLDVAFDDGGSATLTRGEPFFDAEADPVFEHPALSAAAQKAFFVSYEGMVHPVDFSGDAPAPGEAWSLLSDADRAENWRPGGWQLAAWHRPSNRLFVQMHQGDRWTHKQAGEEVWVFDAGSGERLQRIALEEHSLSLIVSQDEQPLLFTLSEAPTLSVFDATSYEHKGDVGEVGITPYLLYVPGE